MVGVLANFQGILEVLKGGGGAALAFVVIGAALGFVHSLVEGGDLPGHAYHGAFFGALAWALATQS